ncbi:MAG: hypothetical protein HY314_00745 [Acidobacteria bacterium]|nr:hypothetical protein [Acidobacteriota bacterium]
MGFPETARLEGPILQELLALGGEERVRFLYDRLIGYFPQLAEQDLKAITRRRESRWKVLVHRAGAQLVKKGELKRGAGRWILTVKGRQRAEAERMLLELPSTAADAAKRAISHQEIQSMLVAIGQTLGRYAEREYQRYDVIWKESSLSPRLSHVFEVQVKGKIESALAKLKHAYDTQRSKPVLIISDERDQKRARQFLQPYLSGSFHEIGGVTTVLGVEEVERMYLALDSVKEILQEIL